MNSNGHNCQPIKFRGDASQNGGFRSKSLFPAQNHSAKYFIRKRTIKHFKLHYANKFYEPPGVETIYNVKL